MDRGAAAELGFSPDFASVRPHDAAGDIKADTRALGLRFHGVFGAEEFGEQFRNGVGRNTDTRIPDVTSINGFRLRFGLHDDLAIFDIVTDGILYEVDDNHREPLCVDHHRRQGGGRAVEI